MKATHGVKAGAIPAHGALEAVKPDQFAQRTVDLPQQHGGAGHGAAAARHLAIDDDNLMSPPGQMLGHQRAGDAGADDQYVAAEILGDGRNEIADVSEPGRPATVQIVLLGIFGVEITDVSPTMLEAGNVERIGTMPVKPGQVPGRGFCSRSRRNGAPSRVSASRENGPSPFSPAASLDAVPAPWCLAGHEHRFRNDPSVVAHLLKVAGAISFFPIVKVASQRGGLCS